MGCCVSSTRPTIKKIRIKSQKAKKVDPVKIMKMNSQKREISALKSHNAENSVSEDDGKSLLKEEEILENAPILNGEAHQTEEILLVCQEKSEDNASNHEIKDQGNDDQVEFSEIKSENPEDEDSQRAEEEEIKIEKSEKNILVENSNEKKIEENLEKLELNELKDIVVKKRKHAIIRGASEKNLIPKEKIAPRFIKSELPPLMDNRKGIFDRKRSQIDEKVSVQKSKEEIRERRIESKGSMVVINKNKNRKRRNVSAKFSKTIESKKKKKKEKKRISRAPSKQESLVLKQETFEIKEEEIDEKKLPQIEVKKNNFQLSERKIESEKKQPKKKENRVKFETKKKSTVLLDIPGNSENGKSETTKESRLRSSMEFNKPDVKFDEELSAKSEKIEFIYKKFGSKRAFEEYIEKRKESIKRNNITQHPIKTQNEKSKLLLVFIYFLLGMIVFDDGSVYEGFVKHGLCDGEGKLRLPDSSIYEGQFKDGFMNGRGNNIPTTFTKIQIIFSKKNKKFNFFFKR